MKVIGISGVAGAGKDLFFQLLKKTSTCKRFSLADELKKEIKTYCKKEFNIDSTKCSREEKNLIRPLLVSHATLKRKQTDGRYWIEKLQPQIEKFVFTQTIANSLPSYIVITDIRYDEYSQDEISWLREELKGVLVHISNFKIEKGKKILLPPHNEEEARENPKLLKKADYIVEWEHIDGSREEIESRLTKGVIKDFLGWVKEIS